MVIIKGDTRSSDYGLCEDYGLSGFGPMMKLQYSLLITHVLPL